MKEKIKRKRLSNGLLVYDCDVFGGDDVVLLGFTGITGNFYLENYCIIGKVFAGGDIILGDNSFAEDLFSNGYVSVGNNSHIGDIVSSKGIDIGEGSASGYWYSGFLIQ